MKKTLIITLVLLAFTCSMLLAQFTPYGSARVGYWYENEDEDLSSTGESRLNLNYYMQSNSRFGARFKDGSLDGRVEFGGSGAIRLLWASYNMGSYKILIGQDETILTQKGTMNWGNENNFVGWGAIDNSRRAQIRFNMSNGLVIAFVEPTLVDVQGVTQAKTSLIPKINLGYKNKLADNINFAGAIGINTYNYDENDAAGDLDDAVLSYVLGLLLDMKFNDLGVKLHANYGQNTNNYGLGSQTTNRARWNADNEEIENVTTMGGFGELSYKVSDKSQVTFGGSYTMSDADFLDDTESAMAVFGQLRHQLGKKFWISPEAGMLENEKGSRLYFGTQLRMDF